MVCITENKLKKNYKVVTSSSHIVIVNQKTNKQTNSIVITIDNNLFESEDNRKGRSSSVRAIVHVKSQTYMYCTVNKMVKPYRKSCSNPMTKFWNA